jgi:hypothetical protein
VSQWLSRLVKRAPGRTEIGGDRTGEVLRRDRQGSVFTLRPRVVCQRRCNGGWIKALDDQCKDLLSPLVAGNDAHFSTDEARVIATWASTKAVIGEYVFGATVTVRQPYRIWLMERQEPPPFTAVWLARYAEPDGEALQQAAWPVLPPSFVRPPGAQTSDLVNTKLTAVVVGHLISLTFMTRAEWKPPPEDPPGWTGALIRLWPTIGPVHFEPSTSVTFDHLLRLRAQVQP